MLIELWERLRGYDKWVQTEATILSSKLARGEVLRASVIRFGEDKPDGERIMGWRSNCSLAWNDGVGQEHTAEYEVCQNSPLFQLYDGQTVTIRYNPENPGQFYLRGVLKSRVISIVKWAVTTVLAFAIALFILLLH